MCEAQKRNRYLGAFNAPAPLSIASDGMSVLYTGRLGGEITRMDLEGNVLGSFGGEGSLLEDVLLEPSGLFYYEDRLYVADSWYSHLVVLSPMGELLAVYGRRGSGEKEFVEPRGVFVRGGIIYVSDTGNGRVQLLGPNGVYVGEVRGSEVEYKKGLSRPASIAVSGSGVIHIIDLQHEQLKLFRHDGRHMENKTGLRSPTEVALAGSGIVVLDSHEKLIKAFRGGRTVGAIGPWGRDVTPFQEPSGLVVAGGKIYASDSMAGEIKAFSMRGMGQPLPDSGQALVPHARHLGDIDMKGVKPVKLQTLPDGGQIVLDRDMGGPVINELGNRKYGTEQCEPASFSKGPDGRVYCLDAVMGKVVIFSPGGDVQGEFRLHTDSKDARAPRPVDIDVSQDGRVYVADRGMKDVMVYGPDGEYLGPLGIGGTNFYIHDPVALHVDRENDIVYVADAESSTVIIYSGRGRLIREVRDNKSVREPVALTVSDNFIYLLDAARPDVKVFEKTGGLVAAFGSRGRGPGEFRSPTSLDIESGETVVVADRGNGRLQRLSFHYDSKSMTVLKPVLTPLSPVQFR